MESNKGSKKITLGLIVSWTLGALFVLTGLVYLSTDILKSLLFFLMAAILLPPINDLMNKKFKLSMSGGVKFVLVVALMIFAGSRSGSTVGSLSKNEQSQNTINAEQPAEPVQKETTIKVTASDLYAKYEANEIQADNLYKDKLLEVSGITSSIGKDILDSPYIALKTNNMFGSVQCMLADSQKDKATSLSKGQSVTLTGRNSGKTITNVLLRDCEIK